MGDSDGDGFSVESVPTTLSHDHVKLLLAGFAMGITVGMLTWSIYGGWKVPILSSFAVWLYLEILWTIHRPKIVTPPQ